ncbi:MAG: GIY-YIG nuclease family protein [Candidatus Omnitrophica bacterium]|nr:GIY-YIG nuclease family protein [Candidatus Omnitrophota bacterium]MBU4302857.1 GIY-YIG nuclease family protein [Candidatus Omnitrophota bacterium]MBU4418337.1 GIY-YIG nuclease family protein [Candidatus Omnitrophota bacterium]MBU4468732.1 GIY-YIG nuclease family protein [Candidatus Omnitrophota bacterium]MCG2707750.1 GIY-YIG nuclease family protein [Candidatus Omnitrophota bacterium]
MVYTYVIKSKKDNKFYTGTTSDLRKRFREHNEGKQDFVNFQGVG